MVMCLFAGEGSKGAGSLFFPFFLVCFFIFLLLFSKGDRWRVGGWVVVELGAK